MLRRLIACLMSCVMLFLPLTSLGEVSTPTDLTPTPPPVETPSPSPTDEPTAPPTDAPTDMPTDAPTDLPTDAPTDMPTDAPTEVPTEVPTAQPTNVPTATPAPTEEPWDESQCDHANIHCLQAPACQVEGCAHVAQDAFGLDYPLCELGQWLLDQQDRYVREGQVATYSLRRNTPTINLDTADVTLWRSGTYTITGGQNRPGATITLAKDRLIVLCLRDAVADRLTLQSNVDLTLETRQLSALNTLELRQGARMTFSAGGALTIANVARPEETEMTVTGGSVDAQFKEHSGRTLYRFDGQGATAVTVAGKAYAADAPQEDGSFCLWLKAADEGMRWHSDKQGDTLRVYQTAKGDAQSNAIVPGQANTLTQPGTYTLQGQIPQGTTLTVACEGVNLLLKAAVLPVGTTIVSNLPYNLVLEGVNTAAADAFLQGSGTATLSGEGSLALTGAAPTAPLNPVSGALTLPAAPAGWTAYPVAGLTAADRLTVDGQSRGLCWNGTDAVYLPTPPQGNHFVLARDAGMIRAVTTPDGMPLFLLSASASRADAGDAASFEVQGPGSSLDGAISADGPTAAHALLSNVQLAPASGAALSVSGGKQLNVTLRGDNVLASSGAPIALSGGAKVQLNCASGRLLLKGQADLSGLELLGNVKVVPEVAGSYTKLLLKDKSGNPVVNQPVTLRVGGKDHSYQTHYDGTLYLWGQTGLNGTDVVATNGQEVYTAVVSAGETQLDTGVEISGVSAQTQPDGSVLVTFAAPEAGSAGIQYLLGGAGQPMADCYVDAASRVDGVGQVVLTGIAPGQVVSFRVYATRTAGTTLTADNDDGFQFSDVYTHRVLAPFKAPESPDAAYTGKAYKCPFELPADASVTYTGDDLNRDGLPWKVGKYVMHVTIPQGSADYLPGTYDVEMEITKAVVYIIPDPNQEKFQGEEDPEFTYTTKGLLGKDEVTGVLTRKPGEDVGNYAFTLTELDAPAYYTLRLVNNAHQFTILPGGGPSFPVFFYEMLHPVRQEIVRRDGRTVAVVLNTQDSLTVTHSVIGSIVFATADERFRPFSPILRHNETTDEVLLQLRCEAELNKDGGYVTDAAGAPLYEGRFLRLSWLGMRNLQRLGVDSLSLSQNGVQLLVRLEDFLNEDMQATIKELGGTLEKARFKLALTPVRDLPEAEQAAVSAAQPLTDAWKVAVTLLLDQQEIPFESYLPSLTVTVDAEPAADILTGLKLYEEETFPTFCALTALDAQGQRSELESVFVTPFRADELKLADYPQVMFTDRYYAAPITQPMTVFLTRR